jgi:hypothetical protein
VWAGVGVTTLVAVAVVEAVAVTEAVGVLREATTEVGSAVGAMISACDAGSSARTRSTKPCRPS